MEVKEINAAKESKQQPLPAPYIRSRDEWESPDRGPGSKPIGRENKSGVEIGNDNGKNGDLKKLQEALDKINETIQVKNIALNYSVDENTKDIVIKVIEKNSERVIRQIPPDEVLRLRGRIKELLGVIFDENI